MITHTSSLDLGSVPNSWGPIYLLIARTQHLTANPPKPTEPQARHNAWGRILKRFSYQKFWCMPKLDQTESQVEDVTYKKGLSTVHKKSYSISTGHWFCELQPDAGNPFLFPAENIQMANFFSSCKLNSFNRTDFDRLYIL
jgi:hypothetical protein